MGFGVVDDGWTWKMNSRELPKRFVAGFTRPATWLLFVVSDRFSGRLCLRQVCLARSLTSFSYLLSPAAAVRWFACCCCKLGEGN